ncbi:MAG: sugar phosphate isomerase/epimerase family protein [Sphaerochaetaceae bacterium]|nr:sugar phosphate isomerase/epimerase [Sphaerochaetaceae bacterium]
MEYGYCTGFATIPLWEINKTLIQEISKAGYDFVEFPLMSLVELSDEDFNEILVLVKNLNLKCNSTCNFFPESIKLQKPEFNEKEFISYLEKAFERAVALGADKIIFGSAAARKRDEKKTSKDEAKQQIINLLKDFIGPKAAQNNIHILIEPMSYSAGNVINTILEADEIVKKTNHPNVKLMIDLLHMQNNNEAVDTILDVLVDVEHIHVSELERGLPSEKMNPFLLKAFKLLRKNGYNNTVSYETVSGSSKEMAKALNLLKTQIL